MRLRWATARRTLKPVRARARGGGRGPRRLDLVVQDGVEARGGDAAPPAAQLRQLVLLYPLQRRAGVAAQAPAAAQVPQAGEEGGGGDGRDVRTDRQISFVGIPMRDKLRE